MRHWLNRWARDERGMEEVEVGIVASLLVLIGALVFFQIGHDDGGTLRFLAQALNVVASQTGL